MKIYSQSDIVFKYSNLVLLLMMLSKKILEIRNAKYAKACPPIHDKKENKKKNEEKRKIQFQWHFKIYFVAILSPF